MSARARRPNYEALAAAAVKKIEGDIMVFAGQRDDTFFVDLGSIFDLGGLRPFNNAHVIPLDPAAGEDEVSGYNTHAIAIQVPIDELTRDGKKADKTKMPVLGIYASASRKSRRVLRDDGTLGNSGKYVQVSRLGNPLINEVIIPLGGKDYWNAQDPSKDKQFQKYYETPELAGLVNFLYPALPDTRTHRPHRPVADPADRRTGPQLHRPTRAADMLRLNIAIQPGVNGACPAAQPTPGQPDRLGVLNADLCGLPERPAPGGRRDRHRAARGRRWLWVVPEWGLRPAEPAPNNLVGDGVDSKPTCRSWPRSRTWAAAPGLRVGPAVEGDAPLGIHQVRGSVATLRTPRARSRFAGAALIRVRGVFRATSDRPSPAQRTA